ncbi:MAG: YdaS family helix-turn-helix protein [Aquabacterium sp.]|jgi:DNA-binding transcriptional regulator YdaS (Cro superfamily)|uniref:helix-turn-helix domain-containing protein n=1 Tax=Aquabacterium sp. TaxID=1872578 RepID=UPI002A35BAB4|nr:YdaS family helix-turn-helix protein [Aquabacterium sp.]MDX9843611.1 YdaS family helix-turn-helix protein [Aquabacterium sp.]
MQLKDYLLAEGLTQAEFGQRLTPAVSQGKVNHWLHGTRRVSLAEALQIEEVTQGKVTVKDLSGMYVVRTKQLEVAHG